jgi:hypothetical protein
VGSRTGEDELGCAGISGRWDSFVGRRRFLPKGRIFQDNSFIQKSLKNHRIYETITEGIVGGGKVFKHISILRVYFVCISY